MSSVFRSFWHGAPLTPIHWACLNSFHQRGHRFELFSYESVNAPAHVTMLDARDILPDSDLIEYINPSTGRRDFAPFADLFRMKMLSIMGGWWCDLDTFCRADHYPEDDNVWSLEQPAEYPGWVGTGQIRFPAGDPFLEQVITKCRERSLIFKKREELGPVLFSEMIAAAGKPLQINGSHETFYPMKCIEIWKLWLPEFFDEVARKTAAALFLPLYQSFPLSLGIDLARRPPEGSFLEHLCQSSNPEGNYGAAYSPDEIRSRVRSFFTKYPGAFTELTSVSGPYSSALRGVTRRDYPRFLLETARRLRLLPDKG